MWYYSKPTHSKFYLDYVGCKESFLSRQGQGVLGFYLDYVGCKELKVDWYKTGGICFISTMWDVKFTYKYKSKVSESVLSRLCGM